MKIYCEPNAENFSWISNRSINKQHIYKQKRGPKNKNIPFIQIQIQTHKHLYHVCIERECVCMYENASCKFWSNKNAAIYDFDCREFIWVFRFFDSFVVCLKFSLSHVYCRMIWFWFAKPHKISAEAMKLKQYIDRIFFFKCNTNGTLFNFYFHKSDSIFIFVLNRISSISCSLHSISSKNCMTQFHERKMSWGASHFFSLQS